MISFELILVYVYMYLLVKYNRCLCPRVIWNKVEVIANCKGCSMFLAFLRR